MGNGATLTRYDITDLNNGVIAEFPVENPPGWDAISLYYAKALQTMGWNASGQGPAADAPPNPEHDRRRPATGTPSPENTWEFDESPDSYFFWGAMHWWPGRNWELWSLNAPDPQNQYWSHCTHGPAQVEKYFLPWHRAYIYFYELAIKRAIAKIGGGPDDWALPYWNYSFFDEDDADGPWPRARLPWVFCQSELPDGSGNPLFLDSTRRGLLETFPTTNQTMFLDVSTPYYAGAYGQQGWEPVGQNQGFNATLDVRPHGAVHVDAGSGVGLVSSTGWMQRTQTAGFDPIFWLHHSEIDRFWAGWNEAGGENPNDATDPDWGSAADDDIPTRWNFWNDGTLANAIVVHPEEMIDTTNLEPPKFPYSYRYANLPTVPAPRQAGRGMVARAVPRLAVPAAPRAAAPVAANDEIAKAQEVVVEHEPVTVRVALHADAPRLLASLDADNDETPKRVILRLDDIVTASPPGNYEVYLNKPDVDRDTAGADAHFVGLFSSFGADHSHGDDSHHHGASASYDITDLVAYLREQGEWDESQATVTFVPAIRKVGDLKPLTAPVTVGSVRIVTE